MVGSIKDDEESENDKALDLLRALEDLDAYLESAKQLFETGGDGGREGIIKYLSASIALIRMSGSKSTSVAPLYVLIRALRELNRNIIHPMLAPNRIAGRQSGSELRDFVIAWAVCNADWLKEIGFKRPEADDAIARRLDGRMPTERAADRITGTTIRNWRSTISRSVPGDYLRDTYHYLSKEKPTFIMSKPRKEAHDWLLLDFERIVGSVRPSDL